MVVGWLTQGKALFQLKFMGSNLDAHQQYIYIYKWRLTVSRIFIFLIENSFSFLN
jgi:hypothetical protein